MHTLRKVISLVFFLITTIIIAQNSTFNISGSAVKMRADGKGESLTDGKITLYKDSVKVQEVKINPKTGFNFTFDYDHVYSMQFTAGNCYDMFLIFDSKAPTNKRFTKGNDLGQIPFYDIKITESQLPYIKKHTTFPFNIYEFNGKDGFQENKNYLKGFRDNKPDSPYKNYIQNILNKPITVVVPPKEAKEYNVSGKFYMGTEASAVKTTNVKLLNEKGETIDTYKTNRFGQFYFKKVKGNKEYTLSVDEGDQSANANKPVSLVNKYNKPVDNTKSDAEGRFKFKLLSTDTNKLNMLSVEDNNLVISGNLLAMIKGKASPLHKKKLNLVIQGNVVVETTETNEFGTFVFTKLPHNENFMIKLAENDPSLAGTKIMITDRNGKTINSTTADAKGGFNFEFLEPEKNYIPLMEIEDSQLKVNFNGKLLNGDKNSLPLGNITITLLSATDKTVSTTTTDNTGNFSFNYVEKTPLYYLSSQLTQPVQKVFVADQNGVIVKEYQNGKNVNTIKLPLLPTEQNRLSTVYVDDPWLKIIHKSTDIKTGYIIPEKVYFEVNDFKITSDGQNILDKVAQVMKRTTGVKIEVSSHTDAQGSDQYNMELSQKRAKSAVEYLVTQGIDKTRLTGVGYGETKLINRCKNDVACTEDEHTQNRRLEFKIVSQ